MKKYISIILSLIVIIPLFYIDNNKVDAVSISKPSNIEELRNANPSDIAKLESYDSRDYNIVTSVKYQVHNICWSYATIAAAETSILREGLYNGSSELNLSEVTHANRVLNNNPNDDPLYLTKGDRFNDHFDRGFSVNGSGYRMLTWNSPALENESQYVPNENVEEFLLEDIIKINYKDPNDIKEAVARYGAVTFSYRVTPRFDREFYYQNRENTGALHASVIVGWDDNIDKNLYSSPATVDGGWIVKNSWGSGAHGEGQGYFVLSYDTPIKDLFAYDFANKDKYDYNYHYDSYANTSDYIENNTEVASMYPVRKSSLNKIEYLKAVNVSVVDTKYPRVKSNGRITAKIYTDLTADEADLYSNKNNPINPNVEPIILRRDISHEGSYTLELENELLLKENTYYSIVINIESDNDNLRVALSKEGIDSKEDLTYYNNNGNWINCGEPSRRMAARIKGFTVVRDRLSTVSKDLKYTNIKLLDDSTIRYNKEIKIDDVLVVSEGNKLVKGIDYKISDVKITLLNVNENFNTDRNVVAKGEIKVDGINEWSGSYILRFPLLVGVHDLTKLGEVINGTVKINVDKESFYRDIKLPSGWEFLDLDKKLIKGENTGNYLIYKGEDESCYRDNWIEVIVNKTGEVIDKINISNVDVNLDNNSFTYTSNAIRPKVEVKHNNKLLVLDKDYTININNNINVGTATITITGIGVYEGVKTINFTITKASNSITNFGVVNGNPSANANFGEIIYKYYSDKECLNEIDKPIVPGVYYVKAIVLGSDNYDGATSDILELKIDDVILPNPEKPVEPSIPDPGQNDDTKLSTTSIILITVIPSVVVITIFSSAIIILRKKKNNK